MGLLPGCAWDHVEPDVCFETDVQPVFVSYCSTTGCHNPTDRANGYDFTTYAGIMEGVRPGRPEDSDIYEALTDGGDDHMPPPGEPQPTPAQVADIEAWIKDGALETRDCRGDACDTSAAVTYSGDIAPLLATNCGGCHGGGTPSGGLDFSDFATVQQNALSGRISNALRGQGGVQQMPPNSPPLPDCYPLKVDKWVADGAPNN